jgi:hypothetical protein
MARRIVIQAADVSLEAELDDSATADAVWQALPFEGSASRWGEEIYFTIPVKLDESKDARQEMALGELGYWPQGSAFCIFFGPTPASKGEEPRAYSNVNPFGHVGGEAIALSAVPSGSTVQVRRLEEESA